MRTCRFGIDCGCDANKLLGGVDHDLSSKQSFDCHEATRRFSVGPQVTQIDKRGLCKSPDSSWVGTDSRRQPFATSAADGMWYSVLLCFAAAAADQ